MTADTSTGLAGSFLDRVVGRPRPLWVTVGIVVVLFLFPICVALLVGVLDQVLTLGVWRVVFMPPTVLSYIFIVSPLLSRGELGVIEALRPLIQMDDESFDRLVVQASRHSPVGEVAGLGLGAAFGLWVGYNWLSGKDPLLLSLYLVLSAGVMFGLLGGVIYSAVVRTRITAELHRQPMCIDIFDVKPFEPIGRQSLVIALVFLGGTILAALIALGADTIFIWQNLAVISFLLLVPVVIFFLNMRDTHRVLAAAQKRELEAVQRNILDACRALMQHIAAGESSGTLAGEINALVAYEERVKATRTWPYNTAMLRTLFFSVIVPGAAALGRFVSELMFE